MSAIIKFTTGAPADAPETKGTTCYFQPESITWRALEDGKIYALVTGPATRVNYRHGGKAFVHDDLHANVWDEMPDWLVKVIPHEALDIARRAKAEILEALRGEA